MGENISQLPNQVPNLKIFNCECDRKILSDDLLYHCHESIVAPGFPYVKSDFATARIYLEEKNLLRLPCIERGISFENFPNVFAITSEVAKFRTSGDSRSAFPDFGSCAHKQCYLNSIELICAVFAISPEAD